MLLNFILLGSSTALQSFLSIGDWGGKSATPYYTPQQLDAAQDGMPKIAKELNISYVLAVGDNFYDSGILGDEFDPRFQETFEDVYTDQSLQVPWYACAGNHDHMHNVTAQIYYTNHSSRWTFPDLYYDFTTIFTAGKKVMTAHFIMIDTVVFSGNSYYDKENDLFVSPKGPKNKKHAESQLQWLEDRLNSSTADYIWVAGHYPIWSVCSHGPTAKLISTVKPLLEKYNATGYIAGHDHCQSFVQEAENLPIYPLSGNGHDCCYDPSKAASNPKDSVKFYIASDNRNNIESGFASYVMDEDKVTVTFYDNTGKSLFSSTKSPRMK